MQMNKEVVMVKLSDIIPNRFQPRLTFDEDALNELANSIKEHGIIQPLILRSLGNKFEIIAGERRYKASTIAGLTEVPAIVGVMDDQTSAELALIENIQRKDLTAIEEAKSYKKILEMGDFTQDELAKRMGKSQSTIANKMRLLSLTNEAQVALMNNLISERHARCLLQIKDEDKQKEVLNKIISERMTVKDTDDYIKTMLGLPHTQQNNKQPIIEKPIEEVINMPEEVASSMPKEDETLFNPNVYAQTKNVDFVNISDLNSENPLEEIDTLKVNSDQSPKVFNQVSTSPLEENMLEPKVEEIKIPENNIVKENKFIPNFDILEEDKSKPLPKEKQPNSTFVPPIFSSVNTNVEEAKPQKMTAPKKLRFATAIRLTKDTVEDIKTAGYEASMEEVETDTEYQIIIKIQK